MVWNGLLLKGSLYTNNVEFFKKTVNTAIKASDAWAASQLQMTTGDDDHLVRSCKTYPYCYGIYIITSSLWLDLYNLWLYIEIDVQTLVLHVNNGGGYTFPNLLKVISLVSMSPACSDKHIKDFAIYDCLRIAISLKIICTAFTQSRPLSFFRPVRFYRNVTFAMSWYVTIFATGRYHCLFRIRSRNIEWLTHDSCFCDVIQLWLTLKALGSAAWPRGPSAKAAAIV